MAHSYSVLGLGAPCLDYILQVDESFLETIPDLKFGMQPIDEKTLKEIVTRSKREPIITVGGSACNTIRGLAKLGNTCAFTGKIGKDSSASFFKEKMQKEQILLLLSESKTHTQIVLDIITPNGSRTFRTFRGAALEMLPEDFQDHYFQGIALFHTEGYALVNEGLIESAFKQAKNVSALVSFDLSSFEMVESFRGHILQLLKHYVDVVFCNVQEAFALTQRPPEIACDVIRSLGNTCVVLMGTDGCWVGDVSRKVHCPAYPVTALDTTGAGDLFASGFLHGYLKGLSLEECAHYGALLGAAVVQVHGTDIPDLEKRREEF